MKIVFFGTPEFAANVLKFLLENGVDIVAVISKPDRPKGRSGIPVPTPVKTVSQDINSSIPVFQPEIVSDPAFADTLAAFQADLFVVVAYGEIIKQHLLDMPGMACINLHASLLPKYRGAAPIQRAIMEGEKESGITIMHMVKKMDAGDMISQVKVPITPDMTYEELEGLLCAAGKKDLFHIIREFERGHSQRTAQDASQVTFAPKIELEDCEIKWNQPVQKIHDLVRGVNPHPGAWCYVTVKGETKRLKIFKTRIGDTPSQKGNLIVHHLELLEVQLEGKKRMSSAELLRGVGELKFMDKQEG